MGRTQLTNTVAWVEIMYISLKAVKSTLLKVNFVEIFVTIVSVIMHSSYPWLALGDHWSRE